MDDDGWDPEYEQWCSLANEWLAARLLAALEGNASEEDEQLEAEQRAIASLVGVEYEAWVHGDIR